MREMTIGTGSMEAICIGGGMVPRVSKQTGEAIASRARAFAIGAAFGLMTVAAARAGLGALSAYDNRTAIETIGDEATGNVVEMAELMDEVELNLAMLGE